MASHAPMAAWRLCALLVVALVAGSLPGGYASEDNGLSRHLLSAFGSRKLTCVGPTCPPLCTGCGANQAACDAASTTVSNNPNACFKVRCNGDNLAQVDVFNCLSHAVGRITVRYTAQGSLQCTTFQSTGAGARAGSLDNLPCGSIITVYYSAAAFTNCPNNWSPILFDTCTQNNGKACTWCGGATYTVNCASATNLGKVCRTARGPCELPAKWTAPSGQCACPSNQPRPSTYTCRPVQDVCDVPEKCDGTSYECPEDCFQPSTTVCRPKLGACDLEDYCPGDKANNGGGPSCGPDKFLPEYTPCRPAFLPTDGSMSCDLPEECTGTSPDCPKDEFKPLGTPCRPEKDDSKCDVAEECTGYAAACPADGFQPKGTSCRPSEGCCDVAETCPGTSPDCPVDSKRPNTFVCAKGEFEDQCNKVVTCDGTNDCPYKLQLSS